MLTFRKKIEVIASFAEQPYERHRNRNYQSKTLVLVNVSLGNVNLVAKER